MLADGLRPVRRELVCRGVDCVLFEAVTRQLKAKAVMVCTGSFLDATLASIGRHSQ